MRKTNFIDTALDSFLDDEWKREHDATLLIPIHHVLAQATKTDAFLIRLGEEKYASGLSYVNFTD
jgi:hypothetical protein